MKRVRERHKTSDLRMLSFLNYLHEITKVNYVYLSIKDEVKKHKVSYSKIKILIDNKIILKNQINNGKKGVRYEYKWNTIKPNIKMAEKVNDIDYLTKTNYVINSKDIDLFNQPKQKEENIQIVDSNKTIQEKKVTKPKKGTHREKKVEVKQQKEFSLFWGLIKIKY